MHFKENSSMIASVCQFELPIEREFEGKFCEACYEIKGKERREYLYASDQKEIELKECEAFVEKMLWSNCSIGDIPALTFSKHKFDEILRCFDELDSEDIIHDLLQSCQDEASVISLVRCMKNANSNGTVFMRAWQENRWNQQQFSFICSQSMNWIIRSSSVAEEDWLIASPMSRQTFVEMLLLWYQN
ncbi:hypothetical protein ABE099_07050 [Paenibacillus turicensis]|uniref:hypothetical protein n=1 Tax=Paenibacillus turicensis TaxID=160487 RepID=UPI003D2DB311